MRAQAARQQAATRQGRSVVGDGGRVQGGAHMFWRSADEGRAVDELVNRGASGRVGLNQHHSGWTFPANARSSTGSLPVVEALLANV